MDGASPHKAVVEVCRPWGACLRLTAGSMRLKTAIAVRERTEKLFVVRGPPAAQDMGAITVFMAFCPSFCQALSSHIRISGPIRCSSFSSVWKEPHSNFTASGQSFIVWIGGEVFGTK